MHDSLNEEFEPPPPLEPKEKMAVNTPCWCGSGIKWKKCHRNREEQKPDPIGKIFRDMHESYRKGFCLHPNASPETCGSKIVRAHTVQKRGGLGAIAEDGHVISPKQGFENLLKNDGKIIPGKHGINGATTFMGFCNIHDNELFEPVETGDFVLDKTAAFLLSFRSIAYEVYNKKIVLDGLEIQRRMDKGRSFEEQCALQEHLNLYRHGLLRGMRDLETWKENYDSSYTSGNYDGFSFYGVAFERALPIVACGAFHPEFDFNGNPLQKITRGDYLFEHICLNLTVVGEQSILALGWTSQEDGPADQLADSYRTIPDVEKANAAMFLAFEHLENIYFRPSWWNSLSRGAVGHLTNRFRSGIGAFGPERTATCLTNRPFTLSEEAVAQELD